MKKQFAPKSLSTLLKTIAIVCMMVSQNAMACIDQPQTLALESSPFFMNQIQLTSRSVSFRTSDNQHLRFVCDTKEGSWSTYADGRLFHKTTGDENFKDRAESPKRTLMQVSMRQIPGVYDPNQLDRASARLAWIPTLIIQDKYSQTAIVIECRDSRVGNSPRYRTSTTVYSTSGNILYNMNVIRTAGTRSLDLSASARDSRAIEIAPAEQVRPVYPVATIDVTLNTNRGSQSVDSCMTPAEPYLSALESFARGDAARGGRTQCSPFNCKFFKIPTVFQPY
jgi:hypothetical protein